MTDPLSRLTAALSDRYAIERELGSGGMTTVYLAEDLKHNRQVAVKVFRPAVGTLLGTERFLREIGIAARLQHPHILPLHDSGSADGLLYYVMPYVEGESLADRLRREGPVTLETAMAITREVASALQYAHRQGVLHRDVKPANILLLGGHAVVADFGIARVVSAATGPQITEEGMAVGTPAYMSPEQATAEPGDLDERSNIYSLGCVLYEMLVEAGRTIAQWAACGWLSGISATACVRAVQEWQRVHESTATFDAIEELRATVRDLQHERDALTLENEQLALRRAEGLREHR